MESNKQIRQNRSSEILSIDRKQRVSLFYHIALHASLFVDFLWIIMNSTKIHSIATNWRELDDSCHCWYFQNGMDVKYRSPYFWCERSIVDNA